MIRVVGTAGHVDHGKSALVEALTGTHPDRLREEREREMTIDLGFAWTTLSDGTEVGFVDVPGHRDFIDNMLAGVGGLAAAIVVVAADEGVMPQTREHVAILDLLEVPRAVIALTKIDVVEEAEWPDLVEEEVRRLLAPTRLRQAQIVRVSSRTRQGLDELRAALTRLLGEAPPARDVGRPRLPIDRAFVMTGFGTVVTGTLLDGGLGIGDETVVLPAEMRARVRGLQTHRTSIERAVPGSRVAVNLSGLDAGRLARGDTLCAPNTLRPTTRLDAHVRVLPEAPVGVKHGQSLKLHVGTVDVLARARVLEREVIAPGEEGWVQLLLDRPIVTDERDRFILRRPAPSATLGGGVVVAPHPERTHRRRDPRVLQRLEQMRGGTRDERVALLLADGGPRRISDLAEALGIEVGATREVLSRLESAGLVRRLGEEGAGEVGFVAASWWASTAERTRSALDAFHRTYPLRPGMPREDLRRRLGLEARQADWVFAGLVDDGVLTLDGARVARRGFEPRLSEVEERKLAELRTRFAASPAMPPSVRECREAVGDELWNLLAGRGEFVELSPEVALEADVYRRWVDEVRASLERGEVVSVAEVRDRFATSRKYALALLEHLDAIGLTLRVGDERKLRLPSGQNSGSVPG